MEMTGSAEGPASSALDECGGIVADAVRLVKA